MSHSFYKKYHLAINRFIENALTEDIEMGDHSGQACFDNQLEKSAVLKVKEDCIIAGIDLAEKIFKRFDHLIKLTRNFQDGESLKKGTVTYTVKGPAKSLLSSERLVLNCMQRMSGIATFTHQLNQKIKHTKC